MKSIFLLSILIFISFARENPFVPTQEFEEEKSRLFEKFLNKNDQNIYIDDSLIKKEEPKVSTVTPPTIAPKKVDSTKDEPKKVQSTVSQNVPKVEEKVLPKEEPVQDKIALVKPQEEPKATKEPIAIKNDTKPKKETTIASKSIKTGLKFVNISYSDSTIDINSSKYKVFKKLDIEDENKIVFDFRAKTNFKTRRFDLDHKYFKQIAIGNHESEGFFRVVVELKEPISKFESTYSDAKVTVKYK